MTRASSEVWRDRVVWHQVPKRHAPRLGLTEMANQLVGKSARRSIVACWEHHRVTTLSEAECVADLRDSRELLEDIVRAPVPLVAYP